MKTNKLLIPLALLALPVLSATPSAESLNKSQREIQIMNNILRASLDAEPGIKVRQLNGTYLAQQGYNFTISASGISGGFNKWSDFFVKPEIELVEDEVVVLSQQSTSELANEAYQMAMEALRLSSEKMREFAEQEREIEYEIREVERERRDLNLERRHAKQEKGVEKEIEKLEEQIAKLQKEKKALREKRDDVKQDLKSQAKEKHNKAAKARTKNLLTVTKSLAQTLCDYGAGLKSLKNQQYVNFVLDKAATNKQDLVIIFKKAEINKCVVGDSDAQKLLASAVQYRF